MPELTIQGNGNRPCVRVGTNRGDMDDFGRQNLFRKRCLPSTFSRHSLLDRLTLWAPWAVLASMAVVMVAEPAAGLDPKKSLTQYAHSVWDSTHGLPHDSVRDIVQTPDGYLWLGTQAGLVRFDGSRFEVLDRRSYPQMANDHIEALAVGLHSSLWIGTFRGLIRWSGGVMRRFGTADGLPGDQIMSLHVTADGTLWIGTYEGGLARLRDGRIEPFKPPGRAIHPIVTALEDDGIGGLWIATFGGLSRWSGGRLAHLGGREGLLSERVWQPILGREGKVWVATDRGLQWVEEDGSLSAGIRPAQGLSNERSISVLEDRDGQIWVGTFGGGLNRIRLDEGGGSGAGRRIDSLQPPQVGHDAIFWTLFEDRDGNLWAGTLLGGLHRFSDSAFTPIRASKLDGRITSWLKSPVPEVVVGVEGKGLVGWSEPTTENQRVGSLEAYASPATTIHAALRSSRGDLWLGGEPGGLWVQRHDDWVSVWPGPEGGGCRVVDLLETRDGVVWAACGRQLLAWPVATALQSDRKPIRNLGSKDVDLQIGEVQVLLEDRTGRLWLGGSGGLARVKGPGPKVYKVEGIDDNISSMWAAETGELWLGTLGRGLIRWRDGEIARIDRRQGLLDEDIHSLLSDGHGNLWAGCSRGVIRIALSDLRLMLGAGPAAMPDTTPDAEQDLAGVRQAGAPMGVLPQVLYDRRDGLGGTDWLSSGYRDHQGNLWFAVRKGVAYLQPSDRATSSPPKVVLESFEIDGRSHPVQGPIWVPAGFQSLSIRYAAPRPGGLHSIRFRHRLLGLSSDWTERDPTSAVPAPIELTYLPPGRYTFQAQASDSAGRYSRAPVELLFEVEPAWTERPSVRWVFFFVGLLLLYLGHLLRLGMLERRRRRLQAQVEEVLAEVRILSGMLPICCACKRIRDDQGFWNRLETFVAARSEARFVRSRCPECEAGATAPQAIAAQAVDRGPSL